MKNPILLSATVIAMFGSMAVASATDSKRTAEYLLSAPTTYEGKTVTLDVSAVKPVAWKSPFPELVFFHAMTIDRIQHKPGGAILVAVPAADSAAFAKKYGTSFEGRNNSDVLKGLFMSTGAHRGWIVDMSGQLAKLMTERKLELPEDRGADFAPAGGNGPGHGPGPERRRR